MGLHTDYLGSIRVQPPLNDREVDVLRSVNATTRGGEEPDPLAELHPDGASVDDGGPVRPGRPGLRCPWTACLHGCCLRWDGVEEPGQPEAWLTYLIDTFLRPGARLHRDARASALGLTFDHVLDGQLVGERAETAELFALTVVANRVVRRVLVPALPGVDEWGHRDPDDERRLRREQLLARRRRFAAAIEDDLRRAG